MRQTNRTMIRLAAYCFALLLSIHNAAAQAAPHGFVHQQGDHLVDGNGQPLMLKGTNLGNWFEVEGYMFHFDGGPQSPREIEQLTYELLGPQKADEFWHRWRENYITESDMDLIEKMGFNSVRVPLHYKFFTSDDAEGFGMLDRLVKWARKDHIYLILDMHCAPGGQTGTNIDDSWGYPWLYSSSEAQDQAVSIWKRIAQRYSSEPIVLGYDLLNEPIPHYPQLQQFNKDLEPMYRKLAAAIRSVDKNHVLIPGGAQWDTNFTVFGPPFDANMMYTFHLYWTKTTDTPVIQKYLDFRAKYNVPVWLGESGENKDEWVDGFRKTLEANQVGWAFWTYKRMDATASVVTFDRPAHWDEIVTYAKLAVGTGNAEKRDVARPSQADIDEAFAGLLKKIQPDQRTVNASYVQALGMRPAQ